MILQKSQNHKKQQQTNKQAQVFSAIYLCLESCIEASHFDRMDHLCAMNFRRHLV